jgi:quinoprotein glucose dehydrogenase
MRAQALELLKKYKWDEGTLYNPAIVGNVNGLLGAINLGNTAGGTNWPGGAYDPETHILYVQANTSAIGSVSVAPPPPGFSDMPYLGGAVGQAFRVREGAGAGTNPDAPRPAAEAPPPPAATASRVTGAGGAFGSLTVDGLPLLKPPYGVVAAINLDPGEIQWRIAHGDTPDNVRHHPALAGIDIPRTGQAGMVGLVVTKTLVIIGDPMTTTTPEHPRGAMLRAYDKQTGEQVGAVWMPAPQSGSPMTYMVDGRQYLVIAVSGSDYSGEYLAFRLPDSAVKQ